jgi:hypothetical protein
MVIFGYATGLAFIGLFEFDFQSKLCADFFAHTFENLDLYQKQNFSDMNDIIPH